MRDPGLVFAFLLDGEGGGTALSMEDVRGWRADQGALWLHLDYTADEVQRWLFESSGVDPLVAEALAAEDTRPRCIPFADGLLISLRGVNANPGADPEDMVAIRIFASRERVISTRRRRMLSAADLARSIEAGEGPRGPGELLALLAEGLIERMEGVMGELEERIDELEERILAGGGQELRRELLGLRQEVIALRRYLSPQREALNRMQAERVDWVGEHERRQLRETTDRLTRHVEELDSVKDRAAVAYEELSSRIADEMNQRMYVLSLIAGLFLPLGFLTGLLGINVGGIPLAESPWGFLEVVLFLAVVAGFQLLWFKRKRWL